MPQDIGTFISNFNGGTRPNRFRMTGTAPNGVGDLFGPEGIYCVATAIPESTVGIIPIPFRGRIYKFPGDRQYAEWTATLLDDQGGVALWDTWHYWSELFNNHISNLSDNREHQPNFCQDLTITHLDHQSDAEIKSITLVNAWPVVVSPVSLDAGAANTLTQFQVTIAYSHYLRTASTPTT